jgi:hypothetical protein
MALYRALRRGQIHLDATPAKRGDDVLGERRVVKIVEPGEIFEYHGKPGSWMAKHDVDDDDEPAGDDKAGTGPGESVGRHGTKSTSKGSSKAPAGDDKP